MTLLALAGCGRASAPPESVEPNVDAALVLATLDDGREITAGWYLDRKKFHQPSVLPKGNEAETVFLTLELSVMLARDALANMARAAGLAQDATHETWREKRAVEVARRDVVRRWARENISITNQDVKDYYNAHREAFFIPASFRWRVIATSKSSRGEQGARERIEQAYQLLEQGQTFDEVQELFSDRPPAERHLIYGPYKEGELPVVKVERAAKATDEGDYTEILDLLDEFQILRIEDKQAARYRPLDDLELDIRAQLGERKRRQARQEFLDQAVARGVLTINDDLAEVAGLPAGEELARLDDPDVVGDERLITVSDLDAWAGEVGVGDSVGRRVLLQEKVLEELLCREPLYQEILDSAALQYQLSLEEEHALAPRMIQREVLARYDPELTDEDILNEYDEGRARYVELEQRAVYALECHARLATDMRQYMRIQAFSEAQARAERVRRDIAEGLPFVQAVQQSSDGPRQDGGRLAVAAKPGELEPAVDNAAFRLRLGEVSEPVRTRAGYSLLWVPAVKKRRVLSLEEAEPAIRENLRYFRQRELETEFLHELRGDMEVSVDEDATQQVLEILRYRAFWDSSGQLWPFFNAPK